jgi:hypothetical protein
MCPNSGQSFGQAAMLIHYGCHRHLIENFVHRRPRKSAVFYGPRVDQMGNFNPP